MGFIWLALIAGSVDACYGAIPKEFHKIPRRLAWTLLLTGALNLVANAMQFGSPGAAAILALISLALYFAIRCISFVGLAVSFRAYATEEPEAHSPGLIVWAWLAPVLSIIASIAVEVEAAVWVYQNGMPQSNPIPFQPSGMPTNLEIHHYIALGIDALFTFIFLYKAITLKNRIFAYQRAELKKKIAERAAERKKAKAPSSAVNEGNA